MSARDYTVNTSDSEWRDELGDEAYGILRQKGTERAFTGRYWDHKQVGAYQCRGCGEELFASATKYDSGSGWPSFHSPATLDCIAEESDSSQGMVRTEVLCGSCGGHLGHRFPDGPQPTGQRYCINSASLTFCAAEDESG